MLAASYDLRTISHQQLISGWRAKQFKCQHDLPALQGILASSQRPALFARFDNNKCSAQVRNNGVAGHSAGGKPLLIWSELRDDKGAFRIP